MSASLLRLLTNYRQQEAAYESVLELARDGVLMAREGQPLSELHALNLRKRRMLAEVSRLESAAEADKVEWQQSPQATAAGVELEALLSRITALIEQILRQEHETDLWILHGASVQEEPPEQPGRH